MNTNTTPAQPATVGYSMTVTHALTLDFLQDIMTTAVESSYEWFAFRNVVRLPEGHERALNVASFVAIEMDEDGGEESRNFIGPEQIVYAMQRMLDGTYVHTGHMNTIMQACAENDAGMIDADLADCILQVACFDEVRYG